MDRARLEALIQGQLDGELSAGERADLARVLLQDADAHRLHDEFARTDRLLRGIPAAEPPPGLRDAILAGSARMERPGAKAGRWTANLTFRIAAAFLGSLLIVGLAYMARDGSAPGVDLQGSLGAAGGTVSLQSEGIVVSASMRRDGDRHRLEFDANSPTPCEVAVKFDPATTSFAGVPDQDSWTIAHGEVAVRVPAGGRSAMLEFSGAPPETLELRAGGRTLGAARLPVSVP